MVQWPSNKVPLKLWDTFTGDVSVDTKISEVTISPQIHTQLAKFNIQSDQIRFLNSIFITLSGDHADITTKPGHPYGKDWNLRLTRTECAQFYETILKPYVRFGTIYGYPGLTNTYADAITAKYPK